MNVSPTPIVDKCVFCGETRWTAGGVCFRCMRQKAEYKVQALTALGWKREGGRWVKDAGGPR